MILGTVAGAGVIKHMALEEYEVRRLEDEGGYQRTVTMLPGI